MLLTTLYQYFESLEAGIQKNYQKKAALKIRCEIFHPCCWNRVSPIPQFPELKLHAQITSIIFVFDIFQCRSKRIFSSAGISRQTIFFYLGLLREYSNGMFKNG